MKIFLIIPILCLLTSVLVSAQKPASDTTAIANKATKIQDTTDSEILKNLTPAEYRDYQA